MAQPILRRPWFLAALGLPIVRGDGELFLSLLAYGVADQWETALILENIMRCCMLLHDSC